MSGEVLQICAKRVLNFTPVMNGTTEKLVLADRIYVAQWSDLVLKVQIHSNDIASSAGSIDIVVIPQSWTPEDPGIQFLDGGGTGTASSTFTIDSSLTAPHYEEVSLKTRANPGAIGSMIRVAAAGSRTSPTGTIRAELSLEVSGKS
jgi:hypothetical protein